DAALLPPGRADDVSALPCGSSLLRDEPGCTRLAFALPRGDASAPPVRRTARRAGAGSPPCAGSLFGFAIGKSHREAVRKGEERGSARCGAKFFLPTSPPPCKSFSLPEHPIRTSA